MEEQKNPQRSEENAASAPVAADTKKKRRPRWLMILLIVFVCLVLVLALVLQCAWWWLHRTINENVQPAEPYTEDEVDANDKDDIVNDVVDANPDVKPEDVENRVSNVKNIALFGVDQESGSVGRSDAILILSIDKENNEIKLTSLARDSLVPIEGHGEEKLTHAWAYGHAKLAIKTVNQAFGMNITDYAYVNFKEFIEVIDYIGGVEVHINQLELKTLGNSVGGVYEVGVHRLNGAQALAYARCRADSDKNRTARQREVLIAMYEQVRRQPIAKLPDTLKKVLRLCHTTLSSDELMEIAKWAILGTPTIESLSLPNSQLKPWSGILDRARGWVYVYDLDAAKKVLYSFIYEVDTKVTGVTQYVPAATEATTATTTIPD